MFLDEATISVTGGNGGNGCVSWRHEKYVPKGGPDGGNGGRGGDVILMADPNTDTLSDFAAKKRFSAEAGGSGRGKKCHGRDGAERVLTVPPGTIVTDAKSGAVLADLSQVGDRVTVSTGGRGGFGNAHFKSSVRRKPDFAEKGEPGEHRVVKLDLKLVADVGIIGYPSVGKSMLISVVSSARPKIAPYPFTTLVPNLGVAAVKGRRFVLCDVPGLIEGASEGKGLGDRFLRHIERCSMIVHLLDLSRALRPDGSLDPAVLIADYRSIRAELKAYSPALGKKRELVVLNKSDLTTTSLNPLLAALRRKKIPVTEVISAATKHGTEELLATLLPLVLAARKDRELPPRRRDASLPILRPQESAATMRDYTVTETPGTLEVHGRRLEQLARMTNFDQEGGRRRFLDVLKKIGLLAAVRRARSRGKSVVIGSVPIDQIL